MRRPDATPTCNIEDRTPGQTTETKYDNAGVRPLALTNPATPFDLQEDHFVELKSGKNTPNASRPKAGKMNSARSFFEVD